MNRSGNIVKPNFFAESIILLANASSTINSISIAYNVLCKQFVTSIQHIAHSMLCVYLERVSLCWNNIRPMTFGSCLFYVWKQCQHQALFHYNLENWFSCRILYLNDFERFMCISLCELLCVYILQYWCKRQIFTYSRNGENVRTIKHHILFNLLTQTAIPFIYLFFIEGLCIFDDVKTIYFRASRRYIIIT